MTDALTIPAAYVPAIAAELVAAYGRVAETAQTVVYNAEDVRAIVPVLLSHRQRLDAIANALDRLDGWQTAAPPTDRQLIGVDTTVIRDAIDGALFDATNDLAEACTAFLSNGEVTPTLTTEQARVGDLLLLRNSVLSKAPPDPT